MVLLNKRHQTPLQVNPNNVVVLHTPSKEILNSPRELFRFLCQYTVPFGYESLHYGQMLKNLGFSPDSYGNYFRIIQGETPLETAFMAHMDTASYDFEKIQLTKQGHCLATNGLSELGADDRAGMTVLLYMAHKKVPGLYCLFVGEEAGGVGSGFAAENNRLFENIQVAVSFDRKGEGSIITHQCGFRCCSDEFAKALGTEFTNVVPALEMFLDDTGLFTDSMNFTEIVPECTNISVGYYGEHSLRECQDLDYLEKICLAAVQLDWEMLPVERDPSLVDVIVGDDNEPEVLANIRLGFTVDLHDLYGFCLDHPGEAAIVISKLLQGFHPSNL